MNGSTRLSSATLIALGWVGISTSLAAEGPSFDCSKAATWSEKAVCKDATLSKLDREMVTLYREAKARTMPLAQDVLKTTQKEWLSKRGKCKQKADAAECLLRVYRRRIDELAGWAGRGPSEEKIAEERAREATLLPEITADVVWDENSVQWREDCDFGDFECVLDAIRSTGASEQAIAFAQRVEGWAYEFEELGKVDVVSWVQAFAANVIQGQYLVNGSPDLIDLSVYVFTAQDLRRPDVRQVLAQLSDGFLANNHFVRKEASAGGTRFIVQADYVRCNACRNDALARVEIAYDVNKQGVFQGSKLLTVALAEVADTGEKPAAVEAEAAAAKEQGPLSARAHGDTLDRIRFKDGSLLVGAINEAKVKFRSSVGAIDIGMREVLGFSDGTLRLTDGAIFKGSFEDSVVGIVTKQGMIQVQLKDVAEISQGDLK